MRKREIVSFYIYLLQSTGGYVAASRFAIATPPPANVLSRGIGWQVRRYNVCLFIHLYVLFLPLVIIKSIYMFRE